MLSWNGLAHVHEVGLVAKLTLTGLLLVHLPKTLNLSLQTVMPWNGLAPCPLRSLHLTKLALKGSPVALTCHFAQHLGLGWQITSFS
jgi:hypothetical protein